MTWSRPGTMPLIGTGGLGARVWSGPAITVTGIDVPSVAGAVNAVSPYARAILNAPARRQAVRHRARRAARPDGQRLLGPDRRPRLRRGPGGVVGGLGRRRAARGQRRLDPHRQRAGRRPAGGGDATRRDDGRVRQHPRPERAGAARRVREGDGGGGGVLRGVRRVLEGTRMTEVIQPAPAAAAEHTGMARVLDRIERLGNKMPDPAILFLWLS